MGSFSLFALLYHSMYLPPCRLVSCGSVGPFALSFRGFLRGPPAPTTGHSESAVTFRFRPNYPNGALLSVAWMIGKLSFYPFYFVADLTKVFDRF